MFSNDWTSSSNKVPFLLLVINEYMASPRLCLYSSVYHIDNILLDHVEIIILYTHILFVSLFSFRGVFFYICLQLL